MQAITSLIGSLFGSNSDATDAEVQQRLTNLEQTTAKQKVTNLILFGLVFVLGVVTVIGSVRKK